MRSFINFTTSDEHQFVVYVFLTMAALVIIACIVDYIRWRRKK